MKRVLFICMPFASPAWGSLALATLKAICGRAGIQADVLYLNIPFYTAIGVDRYNRLRENVQVEICFTNALFPDVDPRYLWRQLQSLDRTEANREAEVAAGEADFVELAAEAEALVDQAVTSVDWGEYDIVGFTTGYHQTVASLALAQRIRERHPEILILFGGAACDGEMGKALLDHFETIDVVVSGEADLAIVPLLQALRSRLPVNRIARVHARSGPRVVVDPGVAEATEALGSIQMDALPVPDYADYFAQIDGVELAEPPRLVFESARGCWWGEKQLCTFCGLNGTILAFRSKTPERVLDELRTLYLRHGIRRFQAADNILDFRYVRSLLPGLRALHQELGITLFYETKSNLDSEEVRALAQAGIVEMQPGIESFSDHVLTLMRKGTTGLNQVRFLRDCVAEGVSAVYGILWGSYGETAADNETIAAAIPALLHLPPPRYVAPVTLERFSPYFLHPERFGLEDVRPAPIYRLMFGERPFDYMRLAYIFRCGHPDDRDPQVLHARKSLLGTLDAWKTSSVPGGLVSAVVGEVLYVADARFGPLKVWRLSSEHRTVLEACSRPRSAEALERELPDVLTVAVRTLLQDLVRQRLLLAGEGKDRTQYVSLPVPVSEELLLARLRVGRPATGGGVEAGPRDTYLGGSP